MQLWLVSISPSILFGIENTLQFHAAALIALVTAGFKSTEPLIHELPPLLQRTLAILGALLAAHGRSVSVQSGQSSDLFRLQLVPWDISLFTLTIHGDHLKIPTNS